MPITYKTGSTAEERNKRVAAYKAKQAMSQTGQRVSGINVDVPVYASGAGGMSYEAGLNLLRTKYGIARDQSYVDPDSVAALLSDIGIKADFGDPIRIQRRNTPGDLLYVPFEERANIFGSTPQQIQQNSMTVGSGRSSVSGAGSATPIAGDDETQFNTGNPKIDDFLNNTWLKLIEAEIGGDLSKVMDNEMFKSISDNVRQTWEPIIGYELGEAEKTFGRSKEEIAAGKTEFERTKGAELTRGLEDIGIQRERTIEDVGIAKQRISRDYTQAMQDSKDAMAARSLAFGGSRIKAERQLGEQKQLGESELERAQSRTLADLQQKQSRLQTDQPAELAYGQGQYGRQLGELEQGYAREKKQIGEELPIKTQEELSRLRQLGGTLLQYPQFNYSAAGTTVASRTAEYAASHPWLSAQATAVASSPSNIQGATRRFTQPGGPTTQPIGRKRIGISRGEMEKIRKSKNPQDYYFS